MFPINVAYNFLILITQILGSQKRPMISKSTGQIPIQLLKHIHYVNTPMQYLLIFNGCKNSDELIFA